MFAIEVRSCFERDEESETRQCQLSSCWLIGYGASVLTAIRIPTSICRAYQPSSIDSPPVEILILEFAVVDACLAARAVAVFDVTTLYHELVDDSMEGGLGVGQSTVLAGAELPEACNSQPYGAWRKRFFAV